MEAVWRLLLCMFCCAAFLPAPWVAAERWVSTLSGDYLMVDSRCSTREIDGPSGLRIGVLRQAGAETPLNQPNLMISLGGGGHTREAYEDLAARVFERILPDCINTGRAPRKPLSPQRLVADASMPDLSPHPCGMTGDKSPWIVVGAAAAPGQSFATIEGCARLMQLAQSMQARWNTTIPVHLAGVSAGGIAALECLVQHSDVFASATAFAGFLESADLDGQVGERSRARALASLRGKPVRIYVGDEDDLFHDLAEEQFGDEGTVMSPSAVHPSGCGNEIVRVLHGVGHELLSELDLSDMCAWMSTLDRSA
jgi:pimeloyl-ACP methyl ester carboxylesterase